MDYAEHPLPRALDGLVAAVWTMSAASAAWVDYDAVPDGCVELIRRHAGRSFWRSEQPPLFVTGLALTPARLRFSGDAQFTGIKLWPWAWHAIGGPPCAAFVDGWRPLDEHDPLAALLPKRGVSMPHLVAAFGDIRPPPIAAVRSAESVAALTHDTGLSPRQLQRLFARETGMPPRSYLRLLRLREALALLQSPDAPLADTAAATGYADQAHMTREFKSLAGVPPGAARARVKGPFV